MIPKNIIDAARAAQRVTGCPASVAIAQWAQESGGGRFLPAPNNYFGIKWHPSCPFTYKIRSTREVYGGHSQIVMAKFIDFPTMEDAFTYHGKLLMQSPYYAKPFIHDWRAFIHHIASIYATDPHYEKALIKLVDDEKLYVYDGA